MLLLAFAVVLLLAVLVSALANRTILSTAVLFLVAGFVLGQNTTGVLDVRPDSPIVGTLAELALFAVLFTDGMRLGWSDLRSAWKLPGRALGWGLPLTLAITALAAHWLVGLPWPEALLIGAILSPTDPVFASALVGNEMVPGRLRHLLNVESGVNDGLALPFVIVFLAVASGSDDLHLGNSGWSSPAASPSGLPSRWPPSCWRGPELLKLATLLVFGALISIEFLGDVSWQGWVFAFLALFLARPAALWVSFWRSDLAMREQAAAMWFGPKGFASVVYGLLVLDSGITEANQIFHLVALTIVVSIVLHSSTDVVVARQFDSEEEAPNWHGEFSEPAKG